MRERERERERGKKRARGRERVLTCTYIVYQFIQYMQYTYVTG